jgi:hypothetical protein
MKSTPIKVVVLGPMREAGDCCLAVNDDPIIQLKYSCPEQSDRPIKVCIHANCLDQITTKAHKMLEKWEARQQKSL